MQKTWSHVINGNFKLRLYDPEKQMQELIKERDNMTNPEKQKIVEEFEKELVSDIKKRRNMKTKPKPRNIVYWIELHVVEQANGVVVKKGIYHTASKSSGKLKRRRKRSLCGD